MDDHKALRAVGELLAEGRGRLGLTQAEFAVRAGLGVQSLRFFEKGYRWPGQSVRLRIETGLGWYVGAITEFRERAATGQSVDSSLETMTLTSQPGPGEDPVGGAE
ncbi:helix-turn-helix domain-containing protein [Pseudarthrobacter psychrotolerans]|uniref:Helix-turn-helix domain-containing protein n=1 Tax=Pseudarthrobacter psychrotolerans TaxID=2697569 RepID=A0A6P1NK73_9MICC|nr:helix-turn-helix transcriptional regulator [Pseudarthrobacter psychrotolerans]QHK19738.1 helix-turn-helix domain-containing protein [Pseudarthrobacter psychrotolerans]